jgi:hypothetical protein
MKATLLTFALFLVSFMVHPQVTLERIYSDVSRIYSGDVAPYKGGYVFYWNHVQTANTNSLLSRTDNAGNILWSFSDSLGVRDIFIRGDSIYELHAGYLNLIPTLFVTSFDSLGINHSRSSIDPFTSGIDTFGFIPSAFCSASDGGFLITGYRDSSYVTLRYVFKLDSLLQIQWIYEDNINHGYADNSSIIESSNGDIVVFCQLTYGGPSVPNSRLTKLNAGGHKIWELYFDGCNSNSLFENNQGQYVIAGSKSDPWSGPPVAFHGYIYLIDTAGTVLWNYTSLYEYFTSACKGNNNEILATGYFPTINPYCARPFLMAFDSAGNFLFRRFFRTDICGAMEAVRITPDSEIALCGIADTIPDASYRPEDFYLIVTNRPQSILAGTEEMLRNDFIVYPNPASDKIFINVSSRNYIFHIYNSTGKSILSFTSNENYTELDVSSFPNGIYFMRIENDFSQELLSKRLLISH